jgi:hypothetical protein
MNRKDYLGEKVFYVLERNGMLTVDMLAEILNEKIKAVSVSCHYLYLKGRIKPFRTGQIIRNRHGNRKPEVFWEVGTAFDIPLKPASPGNRKNHPSEPKKKHDEMDVRAGIDDEDLAWMERYRQQAQQRQSWRNDDARLRL